MTADQAHGLRALVRRVRSETAASTGAFAERRHEAMTVAVVGSTTAIALGAAFELACGLRVSGRSAVVLNAVTAGGVVGPAAPHCLDPELLMRETTWRDVLRRRLADGPLVLSPALGLLLGEPDDGRLLRELDELVSVAFVAMRGGPAAVVLSAGADRALEVVGMQQPSARSSYGHVRATARPLNAGGGGLVEFSARARAAAPDLAVAQRAHSVSSPRT
jgi:hypothetical protein